MDSVNTAYPPARLARLMQSSPNPHIPADLAAAASNAKVDSWLRAVVGMKTNSLKIGSRQVVEALPVWVTLEVLPGGFASGKPLAALAEDDNPNEDFLTEKGAQHLSDMLDTGCYRLQYAEHGALLVVVWLLRNGCVDEANSLMAEIAPYFKMLRFYPEPAETPIELESLVSVYTVSGLIEQLRGLVLRSTNLEIPSVFRRHGNAAALRKWMPLTHKTLALFARTIECSHLPTFEVKTSPEQEGKCFKKGKPCRDKEGRCIQVMHPDCPCHDRKLGCGWPLQQFPRGWLDEANVLLLEFEEADMETFRSFRREWNPQACEFEVKAHDVKLNHQLTKEGTTLHLLITCLKACVAAGAKSGGLAYSPHLLGLNGKLIWRLRDTLAGWNSTRGLPGSDTFNAYMAPIKRIIVQLDAVMQASDFVPELELRLKEYPRERGLTPAALEAVLGNVELRGAQRPVPDTLKGLVHRALVGSPDDLIAKGLITSGEMLAGVIPGITASLTSIGFEDPELRPLMCEIRKAFSARRSLLLTNLQSQVKLDELPWAAAIQRRCVPSAAARIAARGALELIVKAALCNFPHTILPNKLLQSIRALADTARIGNLPLVDEIAADIFERRFSQKYLAAARIAASNLGEDSLYTRYYGLAAAYKRIECDSMTANDFGALCYELAGVDPGLWGGAGLNGQVIERQQLLTTQNLAVLCRGLELELDWAALATKTWSWFVDAISNAPGEWGPRLRLRKDAAYAWRQLVYYVSRLPLADQTAKLTVLKTVASAETAHPHCVATFLDPLIRAAEGLRPAQAAPLGWTSTPADGFFPR